MRYDRPIYFQSLTQGEYNSDTGNYDDGFVEEVKVYASVMDMKRETMSLIYGGIKQGSLIVHLQGHYNLPFSYIRIENKRYKVDAKRVLRTKDVFFVSEVQ